MEQSFPRLSLTDVFNDPCEESHFLIKKIISHESMVHDLSAELEEVQNTNKSLVDELEEEKKKNQDLTLEIKEFKSFIEGFRVMYNEALRNKVFIYEELLKVKEKNKLLTNELSEEQSANKSLDDELAEERSALQYLADELEKEKDNLRKIAYDLSKEKSVSHRLRLERMVYMMCFSFGAISILIYDWCSKLN